MTLQESIRRTNDYGRRINGAVRIHLTPTMDKWRNDSLPDKLNENFFAPTGELKDSDIAAAVALQKQENHTGLMFRMDAPMDRDLQRKYGFEEEVTWLMALIDDNSASWTCNLAVTVRDIQTADIARDMLDVSETPADYRAGALRAMRHAVKVAKTHPDYHWLCAYIGDQCVGLCYALCRNGVIEVDDVETRRAFRKQRVATTLLRYIAQSFDGTVYLHADSGDSVREMYEKLGFTRVDTVYDYYLNW